MGTLQAPAMAGPTHRASVAPALSRDSTPGPGNSPPAPFLCPKHLITQQTGHWPLTSRYLES